MEKPIIEIKNVSKKYQIKHQQGGYVALRDVIANVAKSPFKFFKHKAKVIIGKESEEEFWALKDVNFNIERGDTIGVIGHNGAGKSTLLKILTGITPPTEGEIIMRGRVASLLEVGTGFHPELTGRENIFLNGAILGMSKKEITAKFDEIVKFSGVEKFLDTPVKRYSSGMYVRLAFSVAAHMEPDILLVDEVLAVGDADFQKKCLGKMDEVTKQAGRTIIFVSHNLSAIQSLCNKCILLKEGKISMIGETNDVIKKYIEEVDIKKQEYSGISERKIQNKLYYLSKIELKNKKITTGKFESGDVMTIEISSEKEAPGDNFTVEFFLYNEQGKKISFGAANPVCQKFYKKEDKKFTCELGPIPLTSGYYWFNFSVRVWGQERWDIWEQAIFFEITKCDPYHTNFNNPSPTNGDFIINQNWI